MRHTGARASEALVQESQRHWCKSLRDTGARASEALVQEPQRHWCKSLRDTGARASETLVQEPRCKACVLCLTIHMSIPALWPQMHSHMHSTNDHSWPGRQHRYVQCVHKLVNVGKKATELMSFNGRHNFRNSPERLSRTGLERLDT